ncbi:hypothetical protein D3C80_1074810 [compost metagenome]
MNVAPSESILSTCEIISSSFLYFPPSKKELGVTLRIPITLGIDKSISSPLQLINILFQVFICLTFQVDADCVSSRTLNLKHILVSSYHR